MIDYRKINAAKEQEDNWRTIRQRLEHDLFMTRLVELKEELKHGR